MKKVDIAKALRDSEYRATLTDEQRALLPISAVSVTELDDDVLKSVTGGCGFPTTFAMSCVSYPVQCP